MLPVRGSRVTVTCGLTVATAARIRSSVAGPPRVRNSPLRAGVKMTGSILWRPVR